MRTLCKVFLAGFLLNVGWEFAHSVLYVHYRGETITSLILLRAAVVDGVMIAGLSAIAERFRAHRTLVFVLLTLVVAIGIELWALSTDRWAYTAAMPLVPLLKIGVTPVVQLALTGVVARWVVER